MAIWGISKRGRVTVQSLLALTTHSWVVHRFWGCDFDNFSLTW